jgi:glycosyltransferase involved in cell wall biosynthesis
MSQVALAEDDLDALGSLAPRSTGPFRAISIGRFVDWKGFHLALAAFAEVRRDLPSSEYWLVGDGPARTRLERIVRELGLDAAVTFSRAAAARGSVRATGTV